VSARLRFLEYVTAQVDKPTLWGAKGDDAFDCSGLVTCGIVAAGGPDLRKTHNANALGKGTRRLLPDEKPIPGDLIFFDSEGDGLDEHVGIVTDSMTALDAEGATSKVTTLADAVQRHAKVRFHNGHFYRKGGRIHRNTILDSIDFVTR
jgi:cell wall-associated NlpC family hydrolase